MDDSTPATKGDVTAIRGDIALILHAIGQLVAQNARSSDTVQRLDIRVQTLSGKLDMNLERIDRKLDNLYQTDDQILNILTHMDERLTGELIDHKRRIVALERRVA